MPRHTLSAATILLAVGAASALANTTPAPPCNGDATGDRVVNFADLNTVLSQFGQSGPPGSLAGDVNRDGVVNFADLNIVLSNFGITCWAVGAGINPADLVIRPGQPLTFQYVLRNYMPNHAQTISYNLGQSSGPSALFITPSNGVQPLTPNATYTNNAQAFLQTPTNAGSHSVIVLQAVGQGGANAAIAARVCVVPTGETNAWNMWDGANPTLGRWRGTLTPANVNFNGRSVTERDAGGGGPDTCHFAGSVYAPFTAITGGTWAVGAGNVWGDDFVGWFPAAVTYYRAQGRAPCGTTFPQRMEINCPQGDQAYQTNTLGCAMTATTVSSTRSGATQTRNWP